MDLTAQHMAKCIEHRPSSSKPNREKGTLLFHDHQLQTDQNGNGERGSHLGHVGLYLDAPTMSDLWKETVRRAPYPLTPTPPRLLAAHPASSVGTPLQRAPRCSRLNHSHPEAKCVRLEPKILIQGPMIWQILGSIWPIG